MHRLIFPLIIVSLFFTSCNKEAGEGGTSRITGKVYRYEVNALGEILDEYYISDRDVYIIYGTEDQIYDDRFSTSHDGSYEFKGLQKGTYTIFAYSSCLTCPNEEEIISQTVEITEKKQTIELDDLIIYK